MQRLMILLALCCFLASTALGQKHTITGYLKDQTSGEVLIGASVTTKVNDEVVGTVANLYGFYSLSLPEGSYILTYSFVGFEAQEKVIELTSDQRIDLELGPAATALKEVVITGEKKNTQVTSTRMGFTKLDAQTIGKIPVFLGEADVIKTLKLIPGVQPASELSSGLSVRGGTRDQNLVLLDEANVYNVSHMLGLFSVFNNDAVKNVEFYKGNPPIAYGGRLASVLDVRMKDGNNKRISGTGGIGLLSTRLTLEAPIVKNKGSVLVAGRRSYADLFTRLSKNRDTRNTQIFFYDFNLKANYELNENNRLYLSGYFGRDALNLKGTESFNMDWGNRTGTLRWNHLFSKKLFSNLSLVASRYDYKLVSEFSTSSFDWRAGMEDYTGRLDFVFYPSPKHTVQFGATSTYHKYIPGNVESTFSDTLSYKFKIPEMHALEHVLYAGDEYKINGVLTVNAGLRYTLFQNIGPGTVYGFDTNYAVSDTTTYQRGDVFNHFDAFEPRIGFTYLLSEKHSIKGGYSRARQFVQQASNSTSGTPLDIWLPAGPNIKPQLADKFSVGYFRNFNDSKYESSVEVYYTDMKNQVDFRDHAELFLDEFIEGELRFGSGRAYGLEFQVKKQQGDLTGWVSYTLSRSERTIKGINEGKAFLSPYDRTHNLAVVANYQLTDRISLSANMVYMSGNAFTAPVGRFIHGNVIAPVYSDRNADRMPDHHRLDLGVTLDPKKKDQRFQGSWSFSVYNLYFRKNPMLLYFVPDENNSSRTQAKSYYLPVMPTVTYNFKF